MVFVSSSPCPQANLCSFQVTCSTWQFNQDRVKLSGGGWHLHVSESLWDMLLSECCYCTKPVWLNEIFSSVKLGDSKVVQLQFPVLLVSLHSISDVHGEKRAAIRFTAGTICFLQSLLGASCLKCRWGYQKFWGICVPLMLQKSYTREKSSFKKMI